MGLSVVPDSEGAPDLASMPVSAPAADAQHPAHTIHAAAFKLNGLRTDLLLQSFSDRVFIVVTQMKKLGTIVSVIHAPIGACHGMYLCGALCQLVT